MPLGSQRAGGSRRTVRLAGRRTASTSLGAGLTSVPPVAVIDPTAALMDPAVVAEHKRFCAQCETPVGRARGDQPGRTKGFCPKCRTPFDFDPRLHPGMLVGGQYEVVGCLAHGGMGWIYLARDRNVNGRWVVLKGLLNTGDPDASRAAVGEKQYLAEVEHPLIVEIYNFVTAPDGASYIVMEYVGGTSLNNLVKQHTAQAGGAYAPHAGRSGHRLHRRGPAGVLLPAHRRLLYCDFKPANVIQVGDSVKLIDLGGVRRIDDDASPIYGTVGFQAPEVPRDGTSIPSDIYTVGRTLGRAGLRVPWLHRRVRRPAADARGGAAVRPARLAVPAAAEGDGAGPRGPLPDGRRAARAVARRAARGHVAPRRRLPLGAVDALRVPGDLDG